MLSLLKYHNMPAAS